MNIPPVPVIFCGGSGTHLWLPSRDTFLRQFARWSEEKSTWQQKLQRLTGAGTLAPAWIICDESLRFVVTEELSDPDAGRSCTLAPVRRNKASAIVTAALYAMRDGDQLHWLVHPDDSALRDVEDFHYAIELAWITAQQGQLLVSGIMPKPSCWAGHGDIPAESSGDGMRPVADFIEQSIPDSADQNLLSENIFSSSPAVAIDTAVMKHIRQVATVTSDVEWTDIRLGAAVQDAAINDAKYSQIFACHKI